MTLSTWTLLTVLCAQVASSFAALESRRWGAPRDVVSEYKTYSESQVTVYEDDNEIMSTATGAGRHCSHVTVRVTAFGQTFVLRLIKNRYLFASSYVERVMTEAGEEYRQTGNMNADHCFYTGSVDGYSASVASACTCYGLLGEFTVDSETYSVEPVDESLSGRHRVYKESDSIQPAYVCGNTDEETTNTTHSEFPRITKRKKRSLSWPQDLDSEIRVVELYVVNDFAQYVAMGNDTTRTITRAKTIVNAASALYHQISIYLVLVGIEVWSDGDLITANASDHFQTEREFRNYRRNNINPRHNNDNGHFITGVRFDGGYLGTAAINGMCDYRRSSAFSVDYKSLPGAPGAVMAHEIGHNFGFRHDDKLSRTCACDDPSDGKCIMTSYVNNPPSTRWSQCSTDQLELSYDKNVDYCLHNVPQTIRDNTPDCGNGIVDDGEECDCGNAPASQCNSTCCSNSTCQLTASASCAYGRCCDVANCQLKPAATECRAATGECDLPEYCNGTDPDCPSDVYRRNTESCTVNGESAYCYNGECRSHQSQCRTWWGDNADNGHSICYRLNERGEKGGHCDYDIVNDTYSACSSTDVLCGSLHCSVPEFSLQMLGLPLYALWWLTDGTRCYVFYYGSFYNGPDRPDPGLVPDGASCGIGKMCLNRRCRNVSDVGAIDCGGCSMNGVCNTLGQCHCNNGFMPPDCSQPGCGGSCHSNPAFSGCGGSYNSNPASLCSPPETTTTTAVTTTTEAVTTTTAADSTTTAPATTTSVGKTTTTAAETTSTSPAMTTTAAETTTTTAEGATTAAETTTTAAETTITSPAMTTTVHETTTTTAEGTTTAVETTTTAAETTTTSPATTTSAAETTTTTAEGTTTAAETTTTAAETTTTLPAMTTTTVETTTTAERTTAAETTTTTAETTTTAPATYKSSTTEVSQATTVEATGPVDQLTLIIAGAVASAAVTSMIVGCLIWRAAAEGTFALRPSVSASPIYVSRRPAVHTDFLQSPSYLRDYRGCYNCGYYDKRFARRPFYRSQYYGNKAFVHSDHRLHSTAATTV